MDGALADCSKLLHRRPSDTEGGAQPSAKEFLGPIWVLPQIAVPADLSSSFPNYVTRRLLGVTGVLLGHLGFLQCHEISGRPT